MLAIKEEVAIVGGVQVVKKTAIVATDEGIVSREVIEIRRPGDVAIDLHGSAPAVEQPRSAYVIPVGAPPVDRTPPPPSCCDRTMNCCFKCDRDYDWRSPQGKGFIIVILLLLGYLIAGSIFLAFVLLFIVGACLKFMSDND